MGRLSQLKRIIGEDDDRAVFVILVVVAYLSIFFQDWPSPFTAVQTTVLLAAGVAYTVLGLIGVDLFARRQARAGMALYFVVQLGLGTTIQYLSQGRGGFWLILLPLAAQSVFIFARWWVVAACASLILAFFLLLYAGFGLGLTESVQFTLLYLTAALFTVVFSQNLVREQHARAEVERLAAELGDANSQLRAYAARVEELATIEERNRLAREIHDSLGHYLTVINVQLEAALAVFDRDSHRALDALSKAKSLTQEGLSEVRRSVAALRASPLERGSLPDVVAALVEESRAAGLVAEMTVHGELRELPSQTNQTLYRAAQEGLTNVRKHAHASRVDLTLDFRGAASVRLIVQDNGIGAAGAGDLTNGGFGLLGLRERVQLLGGRLDFRTETGQGFTLEVEVPG